MTKPTDSPIPPQGCICASFWTVRQAHKPDCPLAETPDSLEGFLRACTASVVHRAVLLAYADEIRQYIQQRERQHRDWLLAHGHGGGSWRRIITERFDDNRLL